ncbi:hypothetical protein NUH87_29535 [Pseudomonas batumici]|uniref:hypothetical protein n=1 Tax=Pseudomonas batumici TaxID=226910 RepID=UPI0030CFD69B
MFRFILITFCALALPGCVGITAVSGECHEVPYQASKARIHEAMGEPYRIEHGEDGKELWHYRNGLKWRGVFAFLVIIPVPLVAPIGLDDHTFTFEGDSSRSEAVDVDMPERPFMCGWMMRNEGEGSKLRCGFD